MKYYIYYNNLGQILHQVNENNVFIDLNSLELKEPINIKNYFVEGLKLKDLPVKPSQEDYWLFDYKKKEWYADSVYLSFVIKQKRNRLLLESDWTQLPDVPLLTQQKWLDYRQQLRDITTQPDYPNNVVWPTLPQ